MYNILYIFTFICFLLLFVLSLYRYIRYKKEISINKRNNIDKVFMIISSSFLSVMLIAPIAVVLISSITFKDFSVTIHSDKKTLSPSSIMISVDEHDTSRGSYCIPNNGAIDLIMDYEGNVYFGKYTVILQKNNRPYYYNGTYSDNSLVFKVDKDRIPINSGIDYHDYLYLVNQIEQESVMSYISNIVAMNSAIDNKDVFRYRITFNNNSNEVDYKNKEILHDGSIERQNTSCYHKGLSINVSVGLILKPQYLLEQRTVDFSLINFYVLDDTPVSPIPKSQS